MLKKAAKHIAIESTIYENRYGFFKPAIVRIQRTIANGRNVILDAANSPMEWQQVLGSDVPVISLFFAPSDPYAALARIRLRAQEGRQSIGESNLAIRRNANRETITRVIEFDYWIG